MSYHVFTLVAVAVLSLSVLGPPVQAQHNPSAQELADPRAPAEAGAIETEVTIWANYFLSEEVLQDDAEAVRWYRLAAEQGQAKAQYVLGLVYYWGKGVPHNNVEAYMWLNLAASRLSGADRKRSVAVRDRAAQLMTPAELSEA